MITTNTRRTALALLATAGLLAGCGGDDKETASTAPTTDASATTAQVVETPVPTPDAQEKKKLASPTGKWATDVCTGLKKNALELQPPNVDPASPESTRESLIKFFDQVGTQLDGQLKILEDAGNPPAGRKTYKKAVAALEDMSKSVDKLGKSVQESKATSEKDISLIVAQLGKEMTSLSGYQGPVVDLTKNSDLKAVLAAEPACSTFL